MDFSGKYLLGAPRDQVWQALNDAEVLKQTIPGCEHIEWIGDNDLEVTIAVNLGVAKPTFVGDLTLSNVDPGVSYTLAGKGRGGWLGLASGQADITLKDADTDEGTVLEFAAEGGASGQIMAIGKTLIGASAQKVIDRFFVRFAEAMDTTITPLHDANSAEDDNGSST